MNCLPGAQFLLEMFIILICYLRRCGGEVWQDSSILSCSQDVLQQGRNKPWRDIVLFLLFCHHDFLAVKVNTHSFTL